MPCACSHSPEALVRDGGQPETSGFDLLPPGEQGLLAGRPYNWRVPEGYDPARSLPLVVLLHGYAVGGALQDLYFGLGRTSTRRGFLFAYPDGTRDASGRLHWNAAPTCCSPLSGEPDDVGYITAVIDDMASRFAVDPRRVYLVGHSNGAFMAYRVACERPARIAAIVSLAGAEWAEPSWCTPSAPVAVLEVHGDADETIAYTGGEIRGFRYVGAVETVSRWAARDGCGSIGDLAQPLDLDTSLPGAETRVQRFERCPGASVELWTITSGRHIPALAPSWATTLYDWLATQSRQ